MTFYNPFFPPFINFPRQVSTFSSNNVEKLPQEIEVKKNCKHNLGNNYTYNLFNETDTLIILAILFFLYKQDTKDVPLMLCLFLLLFD